MNNLFIKPQHLEILTNIFKTYCPNAEIWAYGSRLNGNAHEGSDLDLVVKSFNDKTKSLQELKKMLEESDIPFLIDINTYENLPISFQEEINKKYLIIFKGDL